MKLIFTCCFSILIFSFLFAQTEMEPNNSFQSANTLSLVNNMVTLTGKMEPADDLDFFRVQINQPGVLWAELSNVPSNFNTLVVRIYDKNQVLVDANAAKPNAPASVYFLACEPGFYFIQVYHTFGYSSAESYTLRVGLDISDTYECNNSFSSAYPVNFGQDIRASLFSTENDEDFFRVEVTKPGVIEALLSDIPSDFNTMNMALYGPDFQRLDFDSGKPNEPAFVLKLVCDPGYYYIKISHVFGYISSQQYRLLVTFDDSDVYECNNSFQTASPVDLDSLIYASIYSNEADDDFFVVDVASAGVLEAVVSQIPANFNLVAQLYDANYRVLATDSGDALSPCLVRSLVCEPGRYYIRVYHSFGYVHPEPYRLKITLDDSDKQECNNQIADAWPLQKCQDTIFASIADYGDEDYFLLEAPANSIIRVLVRDIPSNLDLKVELRNEIGQVVRSDAGSNGAPLEINYPVSMAASFYLRLFDSGNNDYAPELFQMQVRTPPSINFALNDDQVCLDEPAFLLSGASPLGGYFNGPGVDSSTGIFDPALADVGIHPISYTYADPVSTCAEMVTRNLTVLQLPNVQFPWQRDTVGLTSQPIPLTGGVPANGFYSGAGVEDGVFYPQLAGIGTHVLVYTFTNTAGCSNADTALITVVQLTNTLENGQGEADFMVFPNPFSESLTLDLPSEMGRVKIALMTVDGKIVFCRETNSGEPIHLDASHLSPGFYTLRIEYADKMYCEKVVKQ